MKKLFTIIILTVVLFTACTNEKDLAVEQTVTIQASIIPDSRVALGDEDEKKVNWTTGDIINLTINEESYPFTWRQENTFAYTGDATLPALSQGMEITAAYASAYSTTQSGKKEDIGNYMALAAAEIVDTEQNYGDLNLMFDHGTSVLKLTLSNEAFKSAEVTDITVKAGAEVVAKATETFTGDDENGGVTTYLAILPKELSDVTIHATCNGNTYTDLLTNKTVEAGKIYTVNKTLSYSCVDLGLPSRIKWATCNVGATRPEEYGEYFAWGETETKPKTEELPYPYSIMTYKYCKGTETSFTKYCNNSDFGDNGFIDNLTKLLPEDDVATKTRGCNWRIPTIDDIVELIEYCSFEWTTMNGVNGCLVTSNIGGYTDKSIFLPAAGTKNSAGEVSIGEIGYYWANSLWKDQHEVVPNQAFGFSIGEPYEDYDALEEWWSPRSDGQSVRPVYVGN